MPKIYIATPAHDHRFDAGYVFSLLKLIASQKYPIRPSKVGGAGVARARNNQAAEFLKTDCTHFFCIDSDISCEPCHVEALVEARQPIMCGLYCLKQHELAWCTHAVKGTVPDPDTGRQDVLQSGTGFMCVERRVFERIIAARPDLAYIEDLDEGKGETRWDFFGMGVKGPGTASARLEKIRQLCLPHRSPKTGHRALETVRAITEILAEKQAPGQYRTEDWSFCDLVISLGFKVQVDTRFYVKHTGIIDYPLTNPFATPEQSGEFAAGAKAVPVVTTEWPAVARDAGVPVGYAGDVLAGAYDVPVNFKKPPVVLDIGANYGAFALWASVRWPGAKIHCYEPHPDNFRVLGLVTAGINHGGKVKLNKFGVGRPSWNRLREGKHNPGECSFFDLGEQTEKTVGVVVKPAAALPAGDLVKIDTEGAELEILSQLEKAGGLKRPRAVMLEYHRESDRPKISRILKRAGFAMHAEKARCPNRGEMKFIKPS